MIDFTANPVIDNHCHPIVPEKAILSPLSLAREFYHGLGDIPAPGVKPRQWEASEELRAHLPNMGVVQTLVCALSRLFGCPAELEAVAEERNRRTARDFGGYARVLYEDAGIAGTVVDSDLLPNDPILDLIPGRVMRLFQMGPAIRKLLTEAGSYSELRTRYEEALDKAVRQDGFVGVKSHLAEEVGFGVEPATDSEANSAFTAARGGDAQSYKRVYTALFIATLQRCQDLEVPVHLHCGITGGPWNGQVADADPFLLIPLLSKPEFVKTRVVLLHGAYPWIQNAAAVAHALPHVWVDMSWTTPWISLRLAECYREVIGMAPLSKLMIGSGGHRTPEIAWLAAKTAKLALGKVLGDVVEQGLMAREQAERAGAMILHDNAARLYRSEKGEE